MHVIIGTCASDVGQTIDLLRWMQQLGGCKGHRCTLIEDRAGARFPEAMAEAEKVFDSVDHASLLQPVTGWPDGPNALFRFALSRSLGCPFLWLEPDCVPLKPGWLDAVAQAEAENKNAFIGCIYGCNQPRLPTRLMSGVAVYPGDAPKRIQVLPGSSRAWDVDNAEAMVRDGVHTPLIQHFWGRVGLAPTFVQKRDEHTPINAFTLERIPADAVLWHRNKDGTLIRLLREKLYPGTSEHGEAKPKIIVVFPVCAADVKLAVTHAKWMATFPQETRTAIVAHDSRIDFRSLAELKTALAKSFTDVKTFTYPAPPRPGWPQAPNWAFQSVARHMAQQNAPWLWMEADAVATRPDWLALIQAEYDRCGKRFMGSVVPQMGHMNGVAIYPHDAAGRIPRAMTCTDRAWDYEMKEDMQADAHNSRLFWHAWGVVDGVISPTSGAAPDFRNESLCAQMPPGTALAHRSKNDGLIKYLQKLHVVETKPARIKPGGPAGNPLPPVASGVPG